MNHIKNEYLAIPITNKEKHNTKIYFFPIYATDKNSEIIDKLYTISTKFSKISLLNFLILKAITFIVVHNLKIYLYIT